MKKLLFLVLMSFVYTLSASTMYTLSGIKKVYPVVEISSDIIPAEYKSLTLEEIKSITNKLGIDTKGYDTTSLAMLVSQKQIEDITYITLRLVIGETVMRHTNNKDVFALTYDNKQSFVLHNKDELEDKYEDALDMLLTTFSEQYEEENKPKVKMKEASGEFADVMGYETNYEVAVQKAKKEKKNILFMLVSNYCPWCRKFEQRVLMDSVVDKNVKEKYIPLVLNKEKDEFPQKFNSSFTPIVNFLDYKTLQSYKKIVGYNNKEEFTYFITKDRGEK